MPPNVTFVAPVKLLPVMTTDVPTGPLGGVKFTIAGVTRNFRLLFNVPPEVTALIDPVVAPDGTLVEM